MNGTDRQGLTRVAVRAGTSLAVIVGLGHLFAFARTLILARLLDPREFGLMGLAFIAIAAAEVLSQTGFNRAVVQIKDDPKPYLETLWVVAVVRGLAMAALVSLIAPAVAHFFHTPEVVSIIRVVSLRFVLMGISSPAWYLLERDLKMTRYAMPSLVGSFLDLCVTTVLAFRWHSVWAMVVGYLTGASALMLMTYVVAPILIRPRFDLERARRLYAFGKHIFRYEFLTFFIQQSDRAAIARLADATSLGLYTFAVRLATMPAMALQIFALKVVFPAFARLQEEPARAREAFMRVMRLLCLFSFPVAAGMAAIAPEMVPIVFGDRWRPMIPAFRILCLLGLATTIEQTAGTVGSGLGRPEMAARASFLRVILIALALVPAVIYYGIAGAALAMTGSAIVSTLYILRSLGRHLDAGWIAQGSIFWIPASASIALLGVVALIRGSFPAGHLPWLLALMVAAGAVAYPIFVLLVDRLTGSEVTASIRAVYRSR